MKIDRGVIFTLILMIFVAAACTSRTERVEKTDQTPVPPDNTDTWHDENMLRLIPEDQELVSPAELEGEAAGTWFHEGQFTVRLKDAEGNLLAEGQAIAQGEWMTEEPVPFEVTLRFDAPEGEKGRLVFIRANPSGLPENADSLTLPVYFKVD